MEKQIVEIFNKTEGTKNSQIKGKKHIIESNKAATLISEKFDGYKREKVEREKIMKKMQKEIKNVCYDTVI